MHQKLATCAKFLAEKIDEIPKVAIILGSGLGHFVKLLENVKSLSFEEIPHFLPESGIEKNDCRLLFGEISNTKVVLLQGRLHIHEGFNIDEVVFPIRVLATLGIENLIITNASGAINNSFTPGDLVLIRDHINLMGTNPLIGVGPKSLGLKFPKMHNLYDQELINLFLETAKDLKIDLPTGVYAGVTGPTYETPAEVKMLSILGADIVGMSTVPEAISGRHLGMKVAGISCVANMATSIREIEIDPQLKKQKAQQMMEFFSMLILKVIEKISNTPDNNEANSKI